MSEEFIREVDEELQDEKYAKIWKKIGPYVISLAIGIVLFTSGVVFWNNFTEDKKQKLGDDFTAAVELIKEEDFDTALIALERITDKASDGYVTMAKMKKASILIQKKQILRGLEIYEDLEKTAFDQSFKDMSTILFVLNAIDHRPSEILLNKIERLTTNSSWKFSALELKGFILLKEKKLSESKKTFNTIIEMGNAPTTLASRARDMVDFLEGK
tara:strand:+ start:968 stop:1612 length:645 start_codon:yes stop_codon:yes gene_type:complete